MNSLNFLIILGLFSILWQIPDGVMATPVNKKGTFFNYDDEVDYFQLYGQQKPREKEEWMAGKNLYQMPSKPVLSEDDAELALMSDMSIYTDDDVAWEHEHGRSGIFRGFARNQKLPAYSRKSQNQNQNQNPIQNLNNYMLGSTDMSVSKWNWMEKILRQQAQRF
ncbi:hypothetical protein KR032_002105 [Drosophila birchii]|nr:hypothetical protein KR032_002105 [Drosophila birchii]